MYSNEQQHFPRPFLSCPDPEAYYPAETIQQARTTVFRTLDRGEGLALVFGSAGVGKTLLARLLADEFELHAPVLRMTGFRFPDRRSFLSRILFELKNEPLPEGEDVRLQLIDYFRRTEYRRFFLFIDDAEQLPLFVFDEIRMLLDLTNGRDVRFRAALFGAASLEERLNHPKLARFSQRIVARCWLEPFTAPETAAYLDAQTFAHKTLPFTPEAKKRLYVLSDGIPRRVNQIADLALWFGPTAGNQTEAIDEAVVQKSWNRLEQIPDETAPKPAASATGFSAESASSADSVIEFGTLDDDESDDFPPASSEISSSEISLPEAVLPEASAPKMSVPKASAPVLPTEEMKKNPSAPEPVSEISIEPAGEPLIPFPPAEMAVMSFTDPALNAFDGAADDFAENEADELDDSFDEENEDEEWEEKGEIDAELEKRLQQRLQDSMQMTDIQTPPALDSMPEEDEFYGIPTLKFPNSGKRSDAEPADAEGADKKWPGADQADAEQTGAELSRAESADDRDHLERNGRLTPIANRAGYLEELRLLEMEVEQEAKVIRKIREMQSGLTAFPLPDNAAAVSDEEKQTPPEPETPSEENAPKPSPRPKLSLHPFRSAFERLYRDDSPKET